MTPHRDLKPRVCKDAAGDDGCKGEITKHQMGEGEEDKGTEATTDHPFQAHETVLTLR